MPCELGRESTELTRVRTHLERSGLDVSKNRSGIWNERHLHGKYAVAMPLIERTGFTSAK